MIDIDDRADDYPVGSASTVNTGLSPFLAVLLVADIAASLLFHYAWRQSAAAPSCPRDALAVVLYRAALTVYSHHSDTAVIVNIVALTWSGWLTEGNRWALRKDRGRIKTGDDEEVA